LLWITSHLRLLMLWNDPRHGSRGTA